MRKGIILIGALLVAMLVLPFAAVQAEPAAQFAGCADEVDEEFGARFIFRSLNGFQMNLVAIGVDDFDPTITVRDEEGTIVTCDNNSTDASLLGVELPSVVAGATEESGPVEGAASVSVNVPGDQGRLDYEVIVGSADGASGEFVLLFWGAEVFPATEFDRVSIFSNEGQTDAEVPLVIYVSKRGGGEIAFDPSITFSFGETFEATCGKSSARSLCSGDSQNLADYTITWREDRVQELNGNDVMLAFNMGGDPGEYLLEIGSYLGNSFGPYILAIHNGVSYPAD